MALTDRYDLVELLGEGSFGQVFRATDRVSGRTVAIKVLHRHDDDARRRFHREAVVLHSQLANEYVVELLDHAGLNDEDPYLVLEFCEHTSLRSWVGAAYGWKDIATALMHAAKGLAGVHEMGGLHRDIKPENLLLASALTSSRWRVKLADFGLAGFPHPVTGRMTRSPAGTDGYIAPELFVGHAFQPPADIYSLGVVGVELLVGHITPPVSYVDVGSTAASVAPQSNAERTARDAADCSRCRGALEQDVEPCADTRHRSDHNSHSVSTTRRRRFRTASRAWPSHLGPIQATQMKSTYGATK